MPRASEPPITSQHTLHKRCAIVRTFRTQRTDFPAHITQQDLPLFNTLDFDLALLARLEIEAAEALQFVLLDHDA